MNSAALREARQTALELIGYRFAPTPPRFDGEEWAVTLWHVDRPTEGLRNFFSPVRWRALDSALDHATIEEQRREEQKRDTLPCPAEVDHAAAE